MVSNTFCGPGVRRVMSQHTSRRARSRRSIAKWSISILICCCTIWGRRSPIFARGVAGRAEFRTEPLMGLRARTRFLHDGRALTLESAIVQHGGQGAPAAAAFLNLSRRDRDVLLRFLKSL